MRVRVRFGGRCPGGGQKSDDRNSRAFVIVVDAIISLVRDQIVDVRVSASDVEQDQTFQTESRVQNQNFWTSRPTETEILALIPSPNIWFQYNTIQCNAMQ